jgi:serine/threonine protein kinase
VGGWTVLLPAVAHRGFPHARRKTGDRRTKKEGWRAADYGGLTLLFDTDDAKAGTVFARLIPEDGNDDIVPGGFDPVSIESSQDLKERNGRKSHPVYRADGREVLDEDASYSDLVNYYADDTIDVRPKANDPKLMEPRACQMPEFEHFYFPTCNDFHERDFGRAFDDPEKVANPRPENEANIAYLASGFYRDTWILEDSPWVWPSRYPGEEELRKQPQKKYGVSNEERTSEMVAKGYRSAILKTPRMAHSIDDGFLAGVWTEAIIMERMTYSPRIIDIYGHCSASTMVEVVPIEFEEAAIIGEGFESTELVEKRNRNGVRPYNNFTSSEKLHFALDMAESLADLHGFREGIIVHDDVQMCQWLRTPDGRLKLGDFNRATIMSWDLLKGEYCKFNNGEAFSQYRAPEEFAARNLNEKIDIFSFGNNIYAMLTGLWNWVRPTGLFFFANTLVDARVHLTQYLRIGYRTSLSLSSMTRTMTTLFRRS